MPTTPSPWGDPTTGSFKNRNIREVRVDGCVAQVNVKIVAAVSRLLETLVQSGVELPRRITSYDPAGSDFQALGLALRMDVPYDDDVAAALRDWGFEGVQVANEPLPEFRFMGTPTDAADVNDRALEKHLHALESADVSGVTPHKWPGHRSIQVGDVGADVMFLQLLFSCSRTDGNADEELIEAASRHQRKRGAPADQVGVLDDRFWRRVLPAKLPTVYSGETGWGVRLLQAGLAAQGFATTKVTGIFGVNTAKDVRALQKDHNLRQAGYARGPEWALLLGPSPWTSILSEEDDARAERFDAAVDAAPDRERVTAPLEVGATKKPGPKSKAAASDAA